MFFGKLNNLFIRKYDCILSYCFVKRQYCTYKPVKRPNVKKLSESKFTSEMSTKLSVSKHLRLLIESTGPITVAEYMKQVLTNVADGYYMCRDVFGQQGDFITSPEVGQIFGELVAVWLLIEWQKIGSQIPLQIVEFGPGRGTLMHDVIRVCSTFGLTKEHISLHLIELSPYLSKLQAKKLCYKYNDCEPTPENNFQYQQGMTVSGIPVNWYRSITDVPQNFSIYLAHEFFDALPIHKFQFINEQNRWHEILIDLNKTNENEFTFILARNETPTLKLFVQQTGIDNSTEKQRKHIEYSFESYRIMNILAERLEMHGGFGLIMDYGHFGDKEDTFRAFKNHKLHNPLVEPGTADLTADVDFKQLKNIAEHQQKLITFGPIEQGEFLKKLGGDLRLEILLENAIKKQKDNSVIENLKSGYDMLTNPDKMGSRFKFFSFFPCVLKEHLKTYPVNGFD